MDNAIDGNAPIDYASIQIFPSQNRYEAFVCREKHSEKVAGGLLEHLLPHVPGINDLYAKGLDAKFDLKLPENMHGAEWFSKATVERFLHVVSSPDLTNVTNAITDEMCQLEESKKFHLSLYGKGHQDKSESMERDGRSSPGAAPTSKPEANISLSNASKNELVRAMDLRLTALRQELAATFNKAISAACSPKDMAYLAKFCQHFGATNVECDVMNDGANTTVQNPQISKPEHSVAPVRYGVSPAKVAQVERQSSIESEESSYSSDEGHEGQASAERSRSLIRSASPRRSASPMRRIQIGRAGPRRAAALTIKSLNFFPTRERPLFHSDSAANDEGEVSEQPYKKPEIDVRRITVQDAINLFESKQRDQTADVQKRRSLTDMSVTANKSVLRRWSAGMGEISVQEGQPETVPEDPVPAASNDEAYIEIPKSSEAQVVSDFVSESQNNSEITESDVKPERLEDISSYTANNQAETNQNLGEEHVKRLAASVEWNKRKQAELNQILMKMMESKPVKLGKSQPCRNQNIPVEQRGGSCNDYKEKRDAKFQGEKAGKTVGKEPQFRAKQQTLDKKKAEMASKNLSASKGPMWKPQKSSKSSTLSASSPVEPSKPSVTKKMPSKKSPVPATRKSWSSTPSPRTAGTSPTKIRGGVSSASSTPTRRKSQPTSIPQPITQREKSQQQNKNENGIQSHNIRGIKSTNEKRQLMVPDKTKSMKAKVTVVSGEISAPSKISLCNKGTKKSSVVPLESKSSQSKGSGIRRGAANVRKKKDSPPLKESLRNNGDLIEDQESAVAVNASDMVGQHSNQDILILDQPNAATEPEFQTKKYVQCGERENVDQSPNGDDVLTNAEQSSLELKTEDDLTISPAAWVEIEEDLKLPKPCDDSTFQIASVANITQVGLASPRVRHSLSQMLQEESSEADTSEWGNAENPPAMIYQKDAPKGLKRLLKFARKSKGDTNSPGWSSPSVYSEGEDDVEESKSSQRNADKLLRKATLHAKSNGQPKSSLHEGYERNLGESNLGKLDGKGSNRMQEGRDSGAGSSTKASRSFFSLSAFRGSKP